MEGKGRQGANRRCDRDTENPLSSAALDPSQTLLESHFPRDSLSQGAVTGFCKWAILNPRKREKNVQTASKCVEGFSDTRFELCPRVKCAQGPQQPPELESIEYIHRNYSKCKKEKK